MDWTLFLDDERSPSWFLTDVLIARDCNEARKLIAELGCPSVISFDHDLGTPENGFSFMKWLVEEDLEERIDLNSVKKVFVHSMNPVGAQNIAKLWDGYADEIKGSEVRAKVQPYRYKSKWE